MTEHRKHHGHGDTGGLCTHDLFGSTPDLPPLLKPLVIFVLLFTTPSRPQLVSCWITLERGMPAASLTCAVSFFRPPNAKSHLLVQRFDKDSVIVNLAECAWHERSFHCASNSSEVSEIESDNATSNHSDINDWESQRVTLRLPHSDLMAAVDKSHRYYYVCLPNGMGTAAVPSSCEFPSIGVPGAPTLTKIQSSSSSLQVSWHCDQDGGATILSYELNYTHGNDNHWLSVYLNPDNTSFTAAGLMCGTLYRFVVRAVNVFGMSSDSEMLEAWTNGSEPNMSSHCPLVKEINVTKVTLDFIGLKAKAGAGCPITFFSLKYRRHGNMSWCNGMDTISSDVRQVTVEGLAGGSQYTMVITAHSDAGNASCFLHVSTLPPPSELEREKGEGQGLGTTERRRLRVTVIVLGCLLTLVSASTLVLLGQLLRRRFRERIRRNHQSSSMLAANAEKDSSADPISLQDCDAMLQEEGRVSLSGPDLTSSH